MLDADVVYGVVVEFCVDVLGGGIKFLVFSRRSTSSDMLEMSRYLVK